VVAAGAGATTSQKIIEYRGRLCPRGIEQRGRLMQQRENLSWLLGELSLQLKGGLKTYWHICKACKRLC
jgi:hypothetical protein